MMLILEDREPTPPGEMLAEEFMQPLGLTQTELAKRLKMGRDRLNEIINGRRRITTDTALKLAKAFGTTPEFWINGQLAQDLYRAQHDDQVMRVVAMIKPLR